MELIRLDGSSQQYCVHTVVGKEVKPPWSLEPKFDVVCDEHQIKRLDLPSQKRFISEYVQVMKPVYDGI